MSRNAVVTVFAILHGTSAVGAQTTAADPWRKVPAMQTTCWADLEYGRTFGDIYASVGDEMRRQTEINEALSRKMQELGPGEVQKRMMEFMQKDPQKAMKMMQAQADAAGSIREGVTSVEEAKKELDAEFTKLSASFNEEMDAGAKPFRTRRDEIMKTSRKVLGEENWTFTTKAAETEFNEMIDKENADYQARCSAYFGANGKMHAWLAKYRTTVIDPAARSEEMIESNNTTLMAILESPGAEFRSTAQMKAVREFVTVARKAFDLRRHKVANVH